MPIAAFASYCPEGITGRARLASRSLAVFRREDHSARCQFAGLVNAERKAA
jgi:hypothetical protein